MFDFGGMKRDMRSFRKLEPTEGYPINALSFSPSGAWPRSWAAEMERCRADTQGTALLRFMRGDQADASRLRSLLTAVGQTSLFAWDTTAQGCGRAAAVLRTE